MPKHKSPKLEAVAAVNSLKLSARALAQLSRHGTAEEAATHLEMIEKVLGSYQRFLTVLEEMEYVDTADAKAELRAEIEKLKALRFAKAN
jgi:hypothetical protein